MSLNRSTHAGFTKDCEASISRVVIFAVSFVVHINAAVTVNLLSLDQSYFGEALKSIEVFMESAETRKFSNVFLHGSSKSASALADSL